MRLWLVPRFSALAGIAACVAWSACGPGGEPPAPILSGSDTLLIVLDALNAAHLGCYGEMRATSPHIDALAARGVRFGRAWSQTSWTLPSTASLMTGLYQESHGVLDRQHVLSDEFLTLAEAFANAGYETRAYSQNVFVTPKFGFAQGFAHFEDAIADSTLEADGRFVDRILEYLATPSVRPRFVYAHFRRPHAPYDPPAIWRDGFVDAAYDGEIVGTPSEIEAHNSGRRPMSRRDLRHLRNLYQAGIRAVDEEVGRLLTGVDADTTLIVLLSDHGDSFGEHGVTGHNYNSFEELVHIPLLFAHPALAGGRVVDTPVMSIDVLPTVADLVGLDIPRASLQGRSLYPELRGNAGAPRAAVFTSSRRNRPNAMVAASDGRWKYIRVSDLDSELLFDLHSDPREMNDLAASRGDELARFRRLTKRWEEAQVPPAESEHRALSDQEESALRALGYLGSEPLGASRESQP